MTCKMIWCWIVLLIYLQSHHGYLATNPQSSEDILAEDNLDSVLQDGNHTKNILDGVDKLEQDYEMNELQELSDPGLRQDCPRKNFYWSGSYIATSYVDTWQECSSACGANKKCYKWDWYPSTYSYHTGFRRRCVLKPKNAVLKPWNHGMFSGLKHCHNVISQAITQAVFDFDRSYSRTLEDLKKPPRSPADFIFRSRYPSEHAKEITRRADIFNMAYKFAKRDLNKISSRTMEQLFKLSEQGDEHTFRMRGTHEEEVKCSDREEVNKYRSSDGTCNNLMKPSQGASMTPFSRALPSQYVDGVGEPVGWRNADIPSAREISLKVLAIPAEKADDSDTLTHMVMQFGQFLDHDLGLTAEQPARHHFDDGEPGLPSCRNEEPCFPIQLPDGDKRRSMGQRCMEFVRSAPAPAPASDRLLAPRQQLNEITSYIDASNVYGSEEEEEEELRDMENDKGLLRVGKRLKNGKFLLPLDNKEVTPCMGSPRPQCFLAGDRRVNEQVGIIPMHTIWFRQHNKLATQLRMQNPQWNGNTIYQEARKIVGAQMQHIVYTEWLPKVIGPQGIKELGNYKGYDPNVDASAFNSFTTAAFRFGHTTIQPFLARLDAHFNEIPEGNLPLHEAFFAPQNIREVGDIDVVLRGLFATPAQQEKGLNTELTERLFEIASGVGLDLAALNIQRGRDHGLPSYNHWRKFCGLPKATSFYGLRNEIKSHKRLLMLEHLYKDVDKVDLFAAGVLEDIVDGGRVGPTFLCLIKEQFKRLRDGDRFFYKKQGMFTDLQLEQIKKTTLASIICENSDNIQRVQPDVFLKAGKYNKYKYCSQLPKVDLTPWKDCTRKNFYWSGSYIAISYVDTWEDCSRACGANEKCYKWDWYPSTYSYDTGFRRRCVLKPENAVLKPWNHGMYSGLKHCHEDCPIKNFYWSGSYIAISYVDTWEDCSRACGDNEKCYKWDWYPSTYSYHTGFRRRCVLKPENAVLKPWNHGMFSGLKHCHKVCWRHIPKGCVNGHNMITYRHKSVEECKTLCINHPNCKAFEYGVNHGGRHRCNDGPCLPNDCRLQSGANARNCNGGGNNLDLYIKQDCNVCWRHIPKGCVNGHNMITYRHKSVEECKTLCINHPNCKAFEYGVNHGGRHRCNGGPCLPNDCRLQSGEDARNCNGGGNNLDLYIKQDCNGTH